MATHLRECYFAFEIAGSVPLTASSSSSSLQTKTAMSNISNYNEMTDSNYEVVCVYAKFGCKYTGLLEDVKEHILNCSMRGEDKIDEDLDREAMKRQVIIDCEEERSRQLHSPSYRSKLAMRGVKVNYSNSDETLSDSKSIFDAGIGLQQPEEEEEEEEKRSSELKNTLKLYQDVCNNIHNVITVQMKSVRQMIHDQAMSLWVRINICNYINVFHYNVFVMFTRRITPEFLRRSMMGSRRNSCFYSMQLCNESGRQLLLKSMDHM